MSRNGLAAWQNLRGHGNDASGYVQAPPTTYQAFATVQPRKAPDRSHPACLTPGQRVTSPETHRNREHADHASGWSHATSPQILDADSPTSDLAPRQPFQRAGPSGFTTNTDSVDFVRKLQESAATVATTSPGSSGATPASKRPRWGPTSEDYPRDLSTQGIGSRYPTEARLVPAGRRDDNGGADGLSDGGFVLRSGGVRTEVPWHHHSKPTSTTSTSISISSTEPSTTVTANSDSSIHSSITSSSPSSTSPFSAPPPPPRVFSDVVARNSFLTANQFYFEPQNVGRGTIGDDDGEEFAAGEADDADDFDESESSEEFAALDAIVDYDGECEREGEEASARRGDSVLREWRQWSRVWKWELARLGESRRGFEEGGAGGAWRR